MSIPLTLQQAWLLIPHRFDAIIFGSFPTSLKLLFGNSALNMIYLYFFFSAAYFLVTHFDLNNNKTDVLYYLLQAKYIWYTIIQEFMYALIDVCVCVCVM